jgi:hypothetical protein
MKRRHRNRYLLNLLALSILSFALYLNFVKRESVEAVNTNEKSKAETPASLQAKQPSKEL